MARASNTTHAEIGRRAAPQPISGSELPGLPHFARSITAASGDVERRDRWLRRDAVGSVPETMPASLLAACIRDYGASSPELARGLRGSRASTLASGATGVAYFFYRVGRADRDPALLELAAAWVDRARRDARRANAFPTGKRATAVVGASALYHRLPGVHCVEALIALARADKASARAAVDAFVGASRVRDAHKDLFTGRASLLLGAAAILDAGGKRPPFDRAALVAMGNAERARLWRAIDRRPRIAVSKVPQTLGIAHGWAGLLYATLRWSESSGSSLPPATGDRLIELAERGIVDDANRIRWPAWAPAVTDDRMSMAGWCNGVAGHVFLWTLAHTLTGDVGMAYALACAHRHDGERAWLASARRLAARAGSIRAVGSLRANLFKGDIGVALLQAELRQPESARMPMFERETAAR